MLRRATLEAERRHCGNTTEELTGNDVVPTGKEIMASLMDPRTVNSLVNLGLSSIKDEGIELLSNVYVAFGEQVDAHAQERHDKAHASTDGDPDSDEEGSANDDGKAADSESVNGWESDDEGSPPEDSKPPPRPISRSKDDLKAEFKACFKRALSPVLWAH